MGQKVIKFVCFLCIIVMIPFIGTYVYTQKESMEYEIETEEWKIQYTNEGDSVLLSVDEYIMGVLMAVAPTNCHIETLKALAVITRTKVYRSFWQRLDDEDVRIVSTEDIGLDYTYIEDKEWSKLSVMGYDSATEQTNGMVMTYDTEPILPLFHERNSGVTRSYESVYGKEIAYLKEVESPWDQEGSQLETTSYYDVDVICEQLKDSFGVSDINESNFQEEVSIIDSDSYGYVITARVADVTVTGVQLKESLKLKSSHFQIDMNENQVCITTTGEGEGIGFSIYGADRMASEGKTYDELLTYYYSKIDIEKL